MPSVQIVHWRLRSPGLSNCFALALVVWASHAGSALSADEPPSVVHHPTPLHLDDLDNVFRLSDRITSGSGPETDAAFAALADAGVTTVVSVDGARPMVELAQQHHLRYVHIPIGYDGLSREAQLALVRLVREADGPLYIHCHHGKHRGPAAAAVACLASGAVDAHGAEQILLSAGTSPKYRGLYRDVAAFELPHSGEQLPKLHEVAEVSGMVQAMSQVSAAFEHLSALEANEWRPLADHPDVAADQEALLLWEGLRESSRHTSVNQQPELHDWLTRVAAQAAVLRLHAEQGDLASVAHQLAHLEQECSSCHAKYRDNR